MLKHTRHYGQKPSGILSCQRAPCYNSGFCNCQPGGWVPNDNILKIVGVGISHMVQIISILVQMRQHWANDWIKIGHYVKIFIKQEKFKFLFRGGPCVLAWVSLCITVHLSNPECQRKITLNPIQNAHFDITVNSSRRNHLAYWSFTV